MISGVDGVSSYRTACMRQAPASTRESTGTSETVEAERHRSGLGRSVHR